MENDLLELESIAVSLLHDESIEDHDLVDIQNRLTDEYNIKQKIEIEEEKRQAMLNSRKTILNIIFMVVCRHFNIIADNISINTRKRIVVEPRQIIMSFAYQYLNLKFIYSYYAYSLSIIGFKVGKRDHATVLHAVKTVNNLCDTNKEFYIKYFNMNDLIISKMKKNDVFQYIKI